jgi:hypothetical protein
MRNKKFFMGMLVLIATFGLLFTGCLTQAVVNGEPQKLGFIVSEPDAIKGKAEIASYWETIPIFMWNGIITFGHDNFVEKTRGQSYNLVTKHYYVIQKVSAIER